MDVDVVVMGYLPSRWDSGDEATGPQMDEITTVVLARWPAPERVRSPAPATPAAQRGSQCLDGLRACSCCCARNGTSGAPLSPTQGAAGTPTCSTIAKYTEGQPRRLRADRTGSARPIAQTPPSGPQPSRR